MSQQRNWFDDADVSGVYVGVAGGYGDIAVGAVKALALGTLDYTYPSNKHILGKVISVRDSSGSVRFLDCGNLPFSHEIREFHREKVEERMRLEKKKDYQLIIEDLTGKPVPSVDNMVQKV